MTKFILWILLFIPIFSFAAVSEWEIIPTESKITFTATQNNAPVTGEFKKFSGKIVFDPAQLSESHVDLIIDMNSVSTHYNELTNTLISPDWFNIKLFPHAEFKTTEFIKVGDKHYQAKGNLTLRNKTIPIILDFTTKEISKNKGSVTGSAILRRNDFGVGQGQWTETEEVKNEVKVEFTIVGSRGDDH